jgi:hypothetical protein
LAFAITLGVLHTRVYFKSRLVYYKFRLDHRYPASCTSSPIHGMNLTTQTRVYFKPRLVYFKTRLDP